MSFIKEHGTAAILLAAIFMSLGFMMGKCSSKRCGFHKNAKCHKSHGEKCGHHGHGDHAECAVFISEDHGGHGEEMVIVKALMEDGFVGDTTMVIPGGEIVLSIGEDGEVDVNVDIEDLPGHGEEIHEVHKEVRIIKTSDEH